MSKKKRYEGRVHIGGGKYMWLGRFATKRERDLAKAAALTDLAKGRVHDEMTVEEWAAKFLARYERTRKRSSYGAAEQALRRFRKDMGHRTIRSIRRMEAIDWVEAGKPGVQQLVTMFHEAQDAEIIDRNPFRGLGPKTRGRSDTAPPTAEEFDRLVAACSALKWYAPQMRALLLFAAYSGMRPGEIFALEWGDIDFDAKRIRVERRVHKGDVDTPKNNRAKTIALTPPARDALLGLTTRQEGGLVFRSKRGKRLSQPTLSGYWALVLTKADLEFEFYLATKHFCVHYLYATLNLEPRVIAAQMGWSLKTVLEMLEIYGHGSIGALDEVDAAFRSAKVIGLRDANQTQEGGQGA